MTLAGDASAVLGASSVPTVTAAQMAEVDRLAVGDYGIDLLAMMEQAGSHLAEVVRLEVEGGLAGRRVVVAAGPGNNGGGGLTAARHLANRGAEVRVFLARPALRSSEASRHQLATLIAMGIDCCVAGYDLPDGKLVAAMKRADVIVDAIVGYSLGGPPRDGIEHLIHFVMQARRPIVSLDLPSGLDPDTGLTPGNSISASSTMTLALPKAGLYQAQGPDRAGRLYLADIGLPARLYTHLGLKVGSLFADTRIVRLERDR